MGQQQFGALTLITLGILVAAGSCSAALGRRRRHERAHEPLWSRLLAALATVGLVVGFVTTGVQAYGPPFPHPLWLAQVAEGGFATAIVGYTVTITPTIWRALWAD